MIRDSSMAFTPCSPQFSMRQPNSRPPPLSKVRRPQRLACSLQPLKSGPALPAIFTASSPLHLCCTEHTDINHQFEIGLLWCWSPIVWLAHLGMHTFFDATKFAGGWLLSCNNKCEIFWEQDLSGIWIVLQCKGLYVLEFSQNFDRVWATEDLYKCSVLQLQRSWLNICSWIFTMHSKPKCFL